MAFTPDEKQMIQEALGLYLQLASQQYSPAQVEGLAPVVRSIISKLDSDTGSGEGSQKPAGISDEQFESVCSRCEKLSLSGCTDPITKKFPGKCDPILKYERIKLLDSKSS